MTYFYDIVKWHETFGVPVGDKPTGHLRPDRLKLRWDIMEEEWNELLDAMIAEDAVEIADACADLIVTVLGTAAEYGIPFDDVWTEVNRSNFAKLGPNGEIYRRKDGKIKKPPGWTPPNIAGILDGSYSPPVYASEILEEMRHG